MAAGLALDLAVFLLRLWSCSLLMLQHRRPLSVGFIYLFKLLGVSVFMNLSTKRLCL